MFSELMEAGKEEENDTGLTGDVYHTLAKVYSLAKSHDTYSCQSQVGAIIIPFSF